MDDTERTSVQAGLFVALGSLVGALLTVGASDDDMRHGLDLAIRAHQAASESDPRIERMHDVAASTAIDLMEELDR